MKNNIQNIDATKFGFFRLSKSKAAVDVSPNTLRAYNLRGMPFYRLGKSVFVSYDELEKFILQNAGKKAVTRRSDVLNETVGQH